MNNIENGIKDVEDTTSALKEDITQVESALSPVGIDFKNQSINSSGVISESSIRLLSPMFTAEVGEAFTIGSGYEFRLANINNDDSVTTDTWQNGTLTFSTDRVTRYKAFYINVRNASNPNADISPSEITYNSTISYFGGYEKVASEDAVEQVEARVTAIESKFPSNYSLNHNYTGQEDMIWSWWYYPQVFSFNRVRDKVYWGFTTHDGYTGIAEYDYDTQTVTKNCLKKSDIDDHNGLALYVFDDGTIVCAYAGGHNTDSKMHIRISSIPESIERFEDDIPLNASGTTSYGQFIFYNNELYLFYRIGNTKWGYRKTADKGKTWTNEVVLVTSSFQYYCKFQYTTTSGVIRICMYSNPGSDDSNIRMGFLHLDNGTVYNADNSSVLGTANIAYTNFTIIIPNETNKTQRLMDVAITAVGNPLILYAPFSLNSNIDSVYKIYDSGTITELCSGGAALWNPKYQDGCAWIGTDKIVSIRGYMGSDIVELYGYANNAKELLQTVYTEEKGNIPIRNARPIVDVNEKAFLWHRGYYNVDDYTKFNTDAKLHLME